LRTDDAFLAGGKCFLDGFNAFGPGFERILVYVEIAGGLKVLAKEGGFAKARVSYK
jgi:hypothetical protein